MGPRCPHCDAIYEWTAGELEERVTAPKVYFCQECRELFVLSPDEIEELQAHFRPALQASSAPLEDLLAPYDEEDDVEALEDEIEEAPPFDLRQPVRIRVGPYAGREGRIAVIDGDAVLVLVEGSTRCVRVNLRDVSPKPSY